MKVDTDLPLAESPTVRARARGPMGAIIGRARAWSGPFVVAVVALAVWFALAASLNSTVFPTPVESLSTLLDNFGRAHFRESILDTLELLAISYVLCAVVGAVIGFAIGLLPFWREVFSPLLYAVYSIPKVTLYPLFLLILGIGQVSRISFAFAHGVLPMILIVMGATASVERIHLKLAASLRMGMVSMVRRILIPSVIPALVTGLRLSFGLTFLGLILAEMFSGETGLGYELLRNVTLVRMGDIIGEVVLVAAIALIPTGLLQMVERRVHARYKGEPLGRGQAAV